MHTLDIQRRHDVGASELERFRERFSGYFTLTPGKMVRQRSGLLVKEQTGLRIVQPNLITNEGLSLALDTMLSGSQAAPTTEYLTGFQNNYTPLATNTAGTPGFVEIDTDDVLEAVRETWTPDAESGQSIDNSGTPAQYICDSAGYSMWGMALYLSSTSAFGNTTGALWASALLAEGERVQVSADTVDLTYTFPCTSV